MPGDMQPAVSVRKPVWRYATAMTVLFALAQVINWPLAFVAPIFASMFLFAPRPVGFRDAVALVFACVAIFVVALLFSMLETYPAVQMVLLIPVLFGIFRFSAAGGSPLIGILMMIGFLMFPIIGQTAPELLTDLASGLALALVLGLGTGMIAFSLWPSALPDKAGQMPAGDDPDRVAWSMVVAIMPLTLVFFVFGMSSILTLIFAAILCQQLSAEGGKQTGMAILLANGFGGLVAVLFFLMTVAAPFLPFILAFFFVIMLAGATLVFSRHRMAALVTGGMSAFLVLYGGSIAPFGGDADVKFLTRLFQIGGAVLYVVVAWQTIEVVRSLMRGKSSGQDGVTGTGKAETKDTTASLSPNTS